MDRFDATCGMVDGQYVPGIRDNEDGSFDEVICGCGFLRSDERGSARHAIKAACDDSEDARWEAAKRLDREWNKQGTTASITEDPKMTVTLRESNAGHLYVRCGPTIFGDAEHLPAGSFAATAEAFANSDTADWTIREMRGSEADEVLGLPVVAAWEDGRVTIRSTIGAAARRFVGAAVAK